MKSFRSVRCWTRLSRASIKKICVITVRLGAHEPVDQVHCISFVLLGAGYQSLEPLWIQSHIQPTEKRESLKTVREACLTHTLQ